VIALNFLWHLHQPDYRHPASGEYLLPWVRLHAVKGYSDLLAFLRRHEHASMTVNFSGILLEQLQDYAQGTAPDAFAQLSAKPAAELSPAERQFVLRNFFSANPRTLIRPHSRYRELFNKRNDLLRLVGAEQAAERFDEQDFTDLLVWFNLAWIGYTGQRRHDVLALIARGHGFQLEHQQQVLAIQAEMLRAVLPGYRELAEAGRIELSVTPYHHPILPLLIDLAEGYADQSDPLPEFKYPLDATEQLRRGLEIYQHNFGRPARGVWPAEGSVSDAALAQIAGAGVAWAATDQQNLPAQGQQPLAHLTPWHWHQDGSELTVFFRDTRLSDNISFEYAGWHGAVAGRHLANMARQLAGQSRLEQPVITIALDGENPWENYPDGGERFLGALAEEVAASPELAFRTPSQLLADAEIPALDRVSPGSWIGGNFNIWSRHPETRVAWRRLAQARRDLIDVFNGNVADQLLAAEGSDWFWWYGDDFQTEQAEQFDELFRAHLISAYEAAHRPVPDELYAPIRGERLPQALGEITALIQPQLDGRVTSFYEWQGAVRLTGDTLQTAMARTVNGGISEMWYGFSEDALFLRLDLSTQWLEQIHNSDCVLTVNFSQSERDTSHRFEFKAPAEAVEEAVAFAIDQIAEVRIKLEEAALAREALAYVWVELADGAGHSTRFPDSGLIPFMVISAGFADEHWVV